MKNFYKDYENQSVIKDWSGEYQNEILATWNKEVPGHVRSFNNNLEDRAAIIYFALFVEFHVNRTLEILFPDFNSLLDSSKINISMKVNILASFRLFPKHIFEACRCINNIRNEFAHEFSITELAQLNDFEVDRKKKTIDKLIFLTSEYEGDYSYEQIEDTLKNRFKSLCLNTVTAFRVYEPLVRELRKEKIENS